MKLFVAILGLLAIVAPRPASASWFESCQMSGRVLHQNQVSRFTWRRTYDIRLSVTSAERTDDNLGRSSYTSCQEYVGTEQSFHVKAPRSANISQGGNLTIIRTAVDGFNTQTGDMSTTVKHSFKRYQAASGER